MDSNGSFNSMLDDTSLKLYDELKSTTYDKCGDILDDIENGNIPDQNMPQFDYNSNISINAGDFNSEFEVPLYVDDILKQFEKDMEDKITSEVEEHKNRIFEILSNYRENLSCTLDESAPDNALSLPPMDTDNQLSFNDQTLDTCPLLPGSDFQTASYSAEQDVADRYLEKSQAEIEHSIDSQLLEIACSCFQIYRQLDSQLSAETL